VDLRKIVIIKIVEAGQNLQSKSPKRAVIQNDVTIMKCSFCFVALESAEVRLPWAEEAAAAVVAASAQ
jgi:hypothetical protein